MTMMLRAVTVLLEDRLITFNRAVGLIRRRNLPVRSIAVGSTVKAEATLDKVEGRRLIFTVCVNDASGLVAAGKVTRATVDVKGFLEKAR